MSRSRGDGRERYVCTDQMAPIGSIILIINQVIVIFLITAWGIFIVPYVVHSDNNVQHA